MRKAKKLDSFKQVVHDMWDMVDDEMDKFELKGFVESNNMPKVKAIHEDDNIGVDEVLLIGGYIALAKLHAELHKDDAKDIETDFQKVLDGKMEFRAMTPDNMPEEIVDALDNMVKHIKDMKKGKK